MTSAFQLFINEAELIQDEYSGLKLEVDDKNGVPCISGIIRLVSKSGLFIDSYTIKIVPPKEYPLRFPWVYEIDGRIPKNIDWHVYPDDGHWCMISIPEEILICKKGINLCSFIENQVQPYLFNQKHREMNGFFLKERPHGNRGNIQFFIEAFNTTDLTAIIKGLVFIKQRKEPNRVNLCFCGADRKYRKCHREAYRRLSAFTDQELDLFINLILKEQVREELTRRE